MKCCQVIGAVAVPVLLVVIVGVVVGLTVRKNVKKTFIARCEAFKGTDCESIWSVFEQAYVGRDPCEVPMEAYDPLIATAPFNLKCDTTMFWSKTKDLVHDFTKKNNGYFTVEDTLLGSALDGLTWCGKVGSKETFTCGCPRWTDCENNTVRSFWKQVSTAFADAACGDVSAMLSRDIATPFDPTSVFASIEVKRLHFPRVKRLTVKMVTQNNPVTNCTNASLKNLQKELDQRIKYDCIVSKAQLSAGPPSLFLSLFLSLSLSAGLSSSPEKPCGSCW